MAEGHVVQVIKLLSTRCTKRLGHLHFTCLCIYHQILKLRYVKLLSASFLSWHIKPQVPQGTQDKMWVFPKYLEYFWPCTQILNITWQLSAKPCCVPPVGVPIEGWSRWWSLRMSKGRVFLLPFEAQLTNELLLPLLYHNLAVNSANEGTEKKHSKPSSTWRDSNWPLQKTVLMTSV